MVTQLGRTLRGEKGILRRSIDTHRNGWERVLRSHLCRYSQEILCLKPPEQRLVEIENPKWQFWQKKERFKVKTRKDSLNHKKMRWKTKEKEKKWEVKLKTRKGGLTTKGIPRLKTWKGSQWMKSCDNQASPVYGKAEFDICSEKTEDVS